MLPNSAHPIRMASGSLSAGHGAEAFDEGDMLDLNHLVTNGKFGCKSFVVDGDSAIPYIPHGSVVAVDPSVVAENGDVIACCRNGLTHIKVLRMRPRLQLVSPNTRYAPIDVSELDDFHILGVVTGFGGRMQRIAFKEAPVYSLMDLTPTGDGSLFKVVFEGDQENIEVKVPREDIIKGVKLAYIALKSAVMNTIPFTRKETKIDQAKVQAAIESMRKPEKVDEFEF